MRSIITEHADLVNEGKVSKIHIFTEKSLVFFRHFSSLILTAAQVVFITEKVALIFTVFFV